MWKHIVVLSAHEKKQQRYISRECEENEEFLLFFFFFCLSQLPYRDLHLVIILLAHMTINLFFSCPHRPSGPYFSFPRARPEVPLDRNPISTCRPYLSPLPDITKQKPTATPLDKTTKRNDSNCQRAVERIRLQKLNSDFDLLYILFVQVSLLFKIGMWCRLYKQMSRESRYNSVHIVKVMRCRSLNRANFS